MTRSLAALIAVLALVFAAGCGGDDAGDEAREAAPGVSSQEEAKDKCLEEAKKIEDEAARNTAEEACEAIESGDQEGVRDAAEQQCLDAARQVADPAARKTAEERCKDVSP